MELTENMEEFLNDLIGKRMEQVCGTRPILL